MFNRPIKRAVVIAIAFSIGAHCSVVCAESGTDDPTIEKLVRDGWQIAGFTNTFDNRSALILFRHADHNYLVQCRTGLDVTRKPPVYANCYELK